MYKLSRISIAVLSYQTEISEKVSDILRKFIPEDMDVNVKVTKMRGQYRDRIRMHQIEVTSKHLTKLLLKHFLVIIGSENVRSITNSLDKYYNPDSKSIYLRLDKFKAADSIYEISSGSDVIKVEIKFDIYKSMEISDLWNDLLKNVGVPDA